MGTAGATGAAPAPLAGGAAVPVAGTTAAGAAASAGVAGGTLFGLKNSTRSGDHELPVETCAAKVLFAALPARVST
ncbi:MAG TPA: hypothetical protein VGS57_06495 [Thermoanaerobaculia bacterium]|jgi:hypothetical protein|nr:hypothetical protein [Thermoanaerobaculia bacterium]